MSNIVARLRIQMVASQDMSRRLRRLLHRAMREHTGDEGFEFVLALGLFFRALRTLGSVRTLVRRNQPDDAFALVRGLLEKIINGAYILMIGWDAAADFMHYNAFRAWRDFEDLRKIDPALTKKYSDEFLKDLKAYHDSVEYRTLPNGRKKKRFGRGYDWTEIGLSERARIADEYIARSLGREKGQWNEILFKTAYREGAAYIHGTFASVARSIKVEEIQEVLGVSFKTKDDDPRLALAALITANTAGLYLLFFLDNVVLKEKPGKSVPDFMAGYLKSLRSVH